MESYKTFWDILDVWGYFGTFGDIWGHLGTFEDIWGHLGTLGRYLQTLGA